MDRSTLAPCKNQTSWPTGVTRGTSYGRPPAHNGAPAWAVGIDGRFQHHQSEDDTGEPYRGRTVVLPTDRASTAANEQTQRPAGGAAPRQRRTSLPAGNRTKSRSRDSRAARSQQQT